MPEPITDETDEIRAAWERVYTAFEPMDDVEQEAFGLARAGHPDAAEFLQKMMGVYEDGACIIGRNVVSVPDTPERAERRDALRALLALLGGAA